MTRSFCDLCESECTDRRFIIPIAANFAKGEPCDLVGVEMNLCKECRTKIYSTVKNIIPDEYSKKLSKLALDIKMGYE